MERDFEELQNGPVHYKAVRRIKELFKRSSNTNVQIDFLSI